MQENAAHRWWYVTPRARRRVVLGVFAAGILLLLGMLIFSPRATINPDVDYHAQLRALAADHQPPGTNGWEALVTVGETLRQINATVASEAGDQTRDRINFSRALQRPVDPDAIALELEAYRRFRDGGGLDDLAEALRAERFVRDIESNNRALHWYLLPELSGLRILSMMRRMNMSLAIDAGDEATFITAFEEILAISRAVGAQSFFIDSLVAVAITESALRELRHVLLEERISDAALQRVAAAIERHTPVTDPLRALLGERIVLLDAVQRVFTDDGRGNGRLDLDAFNMEVAMAGTSVSMTPLSVFGAGYFEDRRTTVQRIDEFFDAVREQTHLTAAERAEHSFGIEQYVNDLTARQPLLREMLIMYPRTMQNNDRLNVLQAAVQIMIALERYERQHGSYPEALDALVPDYLSSVPADPIHGGAFQYRLNTDPDIPLPYLLYSTGVDDVDHGGSYQQLRGRGFRQSLEGLWNDDFDALITHPRPLGDAAR